MKSKNPALENSLACLQHPLTLLSIAVLLLNDHVLKVVSPSWLTGKLSDFAGLFFFPFIVTAGLSLALAKFNLSRQRVGQIAFGLVAVWFVLLKTFPPVNFLTTQFVYLFIGVPTRLILDPTDLIALAVMLPAWMMWKQTHRTIPTRFACVGLFIGALAVVATSPRYPTVYSVTNLEYYKDGIVYAADLENYGTQYYHIAISLDGGLTWEEANDIQNIEKKSIPIMHCSHFNPDICFQITKQHQLQESLDNGTNWNKVVFATIFIPNDLILFEWEEKEYVMVAIGEGGIMRRELPDGDWEKNPVLSANK